MMPNSSRSFQSATRSPPPRERRVCFAEPSVEESTEKTTLSSSETFAQPGPAFHGSSRGGIWGRSSPDYGAHIAPTVSSTAALFGRPLLSPNSQFVEEPAFPPTPCWTVPSFSRWPEAFDPSSEAESFPGVPEEERGMSAVPWLRAIGVGLLAAVLLTIAFALALTVDLPPPGFEPASTAMPRVMEIGASDSKIAVPLRPLKVPTREQQTETVGRPGVSRSTTNFRRHVSRTTHRGRMSKPEVRLRHPVENRTRRSHGCGSHFYTYCAVGRGSEVFYSSSSQSCVKAAADNVHVCNHGANRFMSLGSCLSSCVHAVGGRPLDQCYESTLFSTCTRLDAAETWWFFEGSECIQWEFPQGRCPSEGSRVFHSQRECEGVCLHRGVDENDGGRCDVPTAAPCFPSQLRHPYFADMRVEGSARCVKATSLTLGKRRCLVGSNKFDTEASCQRACLGQ
ncbi:uncharacterized protein LOC144094605 [Amblyomma americanum]